MLAAFTEMLQFKQRYWLRTSREQLQEAEDNLLENVRVPLRREMVELSSGHSINTITINHKSDDGRNSEPVLLLHGFGMGAAIWSSCMDRMATANRTISMIDMLGFGLSDRPEWKAKSQDEAEHFFVEAINDWRKAMGHDKIILAGHSFGGYMATAYSEKYPQHVKKLVLLSPVGVPEKPTEEEQEERINTFSFGGRMMARFARYLWGRGVTPQDFMRSLGPVGKWMMTRFVTMRYRRADHVNKDALADYMYHNAALEGSGEYALPQVLGPGVFAHSPLYHRIPQLHVKEIHFIYGHYDWMDSSAAIALKEEHKERKFKVEIVTNCGHQLMLENPDGFTESFLRSLK